MVYPGHSEAGAALTRLFLASFPFHGSLMAAGERLTKPLGLTSARWQVLSVVARAERPETVANIARIMGLTRQAVQRVANELAKAGLLGFEPNPHHKRAVLVVLTDSGRISFDEVRARQVPWVNMLAEGLDPSHILTATRLLQKLSKRFEEQVGEP